MTFAGNIHDDRYCSIILGGLAYYGGCDNHSGSLYHVVRLYSPHRTSPHV